MAYTFIVFATEVSYPNPPQFIQKYHVLLPMLLTQNVGWKPWPLIPFTSSLSARHQRFNCRASSLKGSKVRLGAAMMKMSSLAPITQIDTNFKLSFLLVDRCKLKLLIGLSQFSCTFLHIKKSISQDDQRMTRCLWINDVRTQWKSWLRKIL